MSDTEATGQPKTESKERKENSSYILVNSPHIAAIDQLLLGNTMSANKVSEHCLKTWNFKVSKGALLRRKNQLITAKNTLNAVVAAKEPKETDSKIQQMSDSLANIGTSLEAILLLKVEDTDPMYKTIEIMRGNIRSAIRRASELRAEFDHLGELRWALNLMELRISKMYELELQMGLVTKDNTTNLATFVQMIKESVEMHQSLGLKPRFGDPKLNININVGSEGKQEGQSERYKRLKELAERFDHASPDQREEMRKEMLAGTKLAHVVDAQFTEVPK